MSRSFISPFIAGVHCACASSGVATGAPATATLPPIGSVPLGMRPTTHVAEYPVTAATIADLRREMMRTGPVAEGVGYPGATQWQIRLTYQYERRCALGRPPDA